MTTISLPAARSRPADATRAHLATIGHTVLRAGAGLLFLQHGAQKLFGMFGGFMNTPGATAPLMSLMGLAGVIEFGGGLLLALGLLTRPVALLMLGEMLIAFVTVHLPRGGAPMQNGGELALLYALIFAYFIASGGGAASLDAQLGSHRRSRG